MNRETFDNYDAWRARVLELGMTHVSLGRGSFLAYRDLHAFHTGHWTNNADLEINQRPNGWLYG